MSTEFPLRPEVLNEAVRIAIVDAIPEGMLSFRMSDPLLARFGTSD